MDAIEEYAVDLVHIGAADFAQEDMDEDGQFDDEADWRKARDLGWEMATAIREHQESFLAWFRGLGAPVTDHSWRPLTNVPHAGPREGRVCAFNGCGRPRDEHVKARS